MNKCKPEEIRTHKTNDNLFNKYRLQEKLKHVRIEFCRLNFLLTATARHTALCRLSKIYFNHRYCSLFLKTKIRYNKVYW